MLVTSNTGKANTSMICVTVTAAIPKIASEEAMISALTVCATPNAAVNAIAPLLSDKVCAAAAGVIAPN